MIPPLRDKSGRWEKRKIRDPVYPENLVNPVLFCNFLEIKRPKL